MIKIIHCADLHLGSKMDSRLPLEKAKIRRDEVLGTFEKTVQYARENGVKIIMLSGDVFDSERPIKRDKDAFYRIVKNNPQTDFLYLRGNHDGGQTYEESYPNLKTFSGEWQSYSYDGVTISGIEISKDNASSLYSTLKLPEEGLNIVMLHGQAGNTEGVENVNLLKLRNKNIDYLALGHIHRYSKSKLDARGECVTCGCLEGRGYDDDDDGKKGFVLLTVDDKITSEFVPFAKRKIVKISVDVSEAEDEYQACEIVSAAISGGGNCLTDDILRINLTGYISFDNHELAKVVTRRLENDYFFVSVKDGTVRKFDVDSLALDKSLKGEFVRTVFNDDSIPQEMKSAVISAGLKALAGREVD
ncbi:MAG: metallophosphoesterase [Candidatus Coproplasma sp.]